MTFPLKAKPDSSQTEGHSLPVVDVHVDAPHDLEEQERNGNISTTWTESGFNGLSARFLLLPPLFAITSLGCCVPEGAFLPS